MVPRKSDKSYTRIFLNAEKITSKHIKNKTKGIATWYMPE